MTDIITDNLTPNIKGVSIALGFFDGIHLAHQKVLSDAIAFSKKLGTKSCVLTFKNHPQEILTGKKHEFLTTPQERIEILKKMGFDAIIMTNFTTQIANMTAAEYLSKVIMNFVPQTISVGYNHKFGQKKSGDVMFLSENSTKFGYILSVIPPVKNSCAIVSSTYIKSLIKSGNIEDANKLLIEPYTIKNTVIKGMQRGRTLGFPTANLNFPESKVHPKFGVYLGYTKINGTRHPSVANIGMRPTYGDTAYPLIEINILDFNKKIYGENIEFEFIKKLRDEIKFSCIDVLQQQIKQDISEAIAFFNK